MKHYKYDWKSFDSEKEKLGLVSQIFGHILLILVTIQSYLVTQRYGSTLK